MNRYLRSTAKRALAGLGRRLPSRAVSAMRVAVGYVAVARWAADNGFAQAPKVSTRNRVFDAMMTELGGDAVAYLEFGVYQGASLRYWVEGISNPDAEFYGFDSFEGLPETFDGVYGARHFEVGGRPPTIDDPRVHFEVGWFSDTVPRFQVPTGKRLVLVMDADLYSSTSLVLSELDEHITPGTLIYFDELSRVDHEPAAFDDYRAASGKSFRAVALEKSMNTGAFVCV